MSDITGVSQEFGEGKKRLVGGQSVKVLAGLKSRAQQVDDALLAVLADEFHAERFTGVLYFIRDTVSPVCQTPA